MCDRLLKVRVKLHTGYVSIIAVYTHTNEPKNKGEPVEFYQALQAVTRKVLTRDTVMVMGDFKARVGKDAESWRGTLGKFGPSKQNGNVKLLDFCVLNGLVVANTFFQHVVSSS